MQVLPYGHTTETKKEQVQLMFDNIAHRYDFLNQLLSFGIDRYWRRKAIRQLKTTQPKLILDMATGTGDFAIASLAVNPDKIVGVDLSAKMLEAGREKLKAKKLTDQIELQQGDAEKILFDENKFDACTVAYGVRNFENLEHGLQEIYRVLKPGGQLVILEFSKTNNVLFGMIYKLYFKYMCPFIGRLVSKDVSAYSYLYHSVQAFPSGKDFENILIKTGFTQTKIQPLTFGACSIYSGIK